MDEQYNTKDDDDWEMNSGLYLTQFLLLDIYVYTTHTGNQFLIQSYLLNRLFLSLKREDM